MSLLLVSRIMTQDTCRTPTRQIPEQMLLTRNLSFDNNLSPQMPQYSFKPIPQSPLRILNSQSRIHWHPQSHMTKYHTYPGPIECK